MLTLSSVVRPITRSLLIGSLAVAASFASAQQIPSVHGTSFSDAKVDLPEDLQGKVGILVVGFSQNSRDETTAWGKRLAVDYYNSPSVDYYVMPVLAAVPKMMRGFVAGRIKSTVSERGKQHFLPLLDYEQSWRALTHYNKPDDSYILLIDGTGRVHWQTHGAPTDATYAALKQQVDALRPQRP